MFITAGIARPAPANRHFVTRDELLSLRHWPPAKPKGRQRMAIRAGHHLSPIRGRGMEYDDVRAYQVGDDTRHLDWRLMARTQSAYTKLFREERERPVCVLADLRPSMHFATRGHFKAVLAAYASAMVVWTTLNNGDRIGAQLLYADAERFPATARRQNAAALVARLAQCTASSGEASAPPSLTQALADADSQLTSGTLLYIFSDFHDVSSAMTQHLMRLATRCELKLVLISDPLESHLPDTGTYRFAGQGRELLLSADKTQQLHYQQQFNARLAMLEQLHGLKGVEFAHWQTCQHPLFGLPEGDT